MDADLSVLPEDPQRFNNVLANGTGEFVNNERISANRSYFGDFDPFGDFDLHFGAAKLKVENAEMPIRYGARAHRTISIQRWKHS